MRLAAFRPFGGAVEVGANGEHHGCLRHHRLVEMRRSELALHLVGTGHDDAVELQVSHRLRAHRLGEHTVEQFVTHRFVGIFSYSLSGYYRFHRYFDFSFVRFPAKLVIIWQ